MNGRKQSETGSALSSPRNCCLCCFRHGSVEVNRYSFRFPKLSLAREDYESKCVMKKRKKKKKKKNTQPAACIALRRQVPSISRRFGFPDLAESFKWIKRWRVKIRVIYRHMWKLEDASIGADPLYFSRQCRWYVTLHDDILMQSATGEREVSERMKIGSPAWEITPNASRVARHETQETRPGDIGSVLWHRANRLQFVGKAMAPVNERVAVEASGIIRHKRDQRVGQGTRADSRRDSRRDLDSPRVGILALLSSSLQNTNMY